jgi:hypothetical protein
MRGRKGFYRVFIEREMAEFLMGFDSNLMLNDFGKGVRNPKN